MDYSHGIVHTPSDIVVNTNGNIGEIVPSEYSLGNTRYVRIYWVDFANVRRCRIVPIDHFKALCKSNRPGVNIAKVCFGLVYLSVALGFAPIGEYLYAIDISSMRHCPFASGHAMVLGNFEEKSPIVDATGSSTVEAKLCPRTILRNILQKTKKIYETEYLVGFETEFILLKSTDPVEASNIHDWSASNGILAGSLEANILEEIANGITHAGIKLEMFHSEAGPGQYEFVTGPLGPLEAADALIFTREIVVQVAAKHGLHATLAPRPFMNSTGSSTHAHISIHNSSETKPADRLSKSESSFLAGLLDHLPAISALTLPTSASYARTADGVWSGGTFVCFGTENREAPVRLTNAASPLSRNFELRFIDGTANPHLALAAVFAAAFLALKNDTKLEMGDCLEKSAAEMTESERHALGIIRKMPSSIEEARINLEHNVALVEILGSEFVEKYLSVNRTLQEALIQDESAAQRLSRLVKFF